MPGHKRIYPNEWDILNGIANYYIERHEWPSLRQFTARLGAGSMARVFGRIKKLEQVGVVEWKDGEGIVLKVPLIQPVRISILPGNEFVEVHHDGKVTIDGKEAQVILPKDLFAGDRRDDLDSAG